MDKYISKRQKNQNTELNEVLKPKKPSLTVDVKSIKQHVLQAALRSEIDIFKYAQLLHNEDYLNSYKLPTERVSNIYYPKNDKIFIAPWDDLPVESWGTPTPNLGSILKTSIWPEYEYFDRLGINKTVLNYKDTLLDAFPKSKYYVEHLISEDYKKKKYLEKCEEEKAVRSSIDYFNTDWDDY